MAELTKEIVTKALKKVTDPELHINIVDLGLVYDVKIDKGMVVIEMTLTSPACPVGPLILEAVETNVKKINGVTGVTINIVWDPAWTADKMSDEAKMELGIS
jgi:metal-sulfur cluster biosynthetic enzyme